MGFASACVARLSWVYGGFSVGDCASDTGDALSGHPRSGNDAHPDRTAHSASPGAWRDKQANRRPSCRALPVVKNALTGIYQKLGVKNRSEAILYYWNVAGALVAS